MKRIKVFLVSAGLVFLGLQFIPQQSAEAHYFDVWALHETVIGENGEIEGYQCILCDEFGRCISLKCKRDPWGELE